MDFLVLNELLKYIILALVFLIAIGFHEYAHAITSSMLGDPTPKNEGRLTPNPFKHMDPIGFILIFLIHFGWGKPVNVNPTYYKNPLRDELIVALAGPASNILMAMMGAFFWVLSIKFGQNNYLIDQFFQIFIFINISLSIFNLLPIPPLDGYRIIKFLKPQWASFMEQNMIYFFIFLLLLVFIPGSPLGTFILAIVNPIYKFILNIASILLL